MNKTALGANASQRAAGRPSLYISDTLTSVPEERISILDGFEPGRSASQKRWVTLGMAVVVLLVGTLYWLISNYKPQNLSSPIATGLAIAAKSSAQSHVILDPKPPAIAVASAPSIEEPSVATIMTVKDEPQPSIEQKKDNPTNEQTNKATGVNSRPNSTQQVVAQVAAKDTEPSHPFAQLDSEPVAKYHSKVAKTDVVASTVHHKKLTEQKKDAEDLARKTKPNAAKAETKLAAESGRTPAVASSAKSNTKDGDVDLIAALLSQVSRPNTTDKNVPRKSTETPSAKVRSAVGESSSAKREKYGESNRDIVVARTSNESTEALVKRCRALGFFEGELCRMRICSGRWGTDPACPGNSRVSDNDR